MHRLFDDLRQAARALRRAPGFTLTTVLTVALGVGATTAMFAVLNGVVLRPLPYPEPDRLVRVWSAEAARDLPFFSVSSPDALDWAAQARSLETLGAFERPEAQVSTGGERAEEVLVSRATASLFGVLAVAPRLGRGFAPADGPDVVVIGPELWRRRFASDPTVVGRTLTLDGRACTIVGVMPDGFAVPGPAADAWRPLELRAGDDRSRRFLRVLARVRTGADVAAARAELTTVASRLAAAHPETNEGWSVTVSPLAEAVVAPPLRRALALLLGVVALVLVIACANVAHLVLVRGAARERDLAIRASLGAGRSQLMAPQLAECALIAAAGGALGVLLAWWTLALVRSVGAAELPRIAEVRLDLATGAFAVAASLAAALLFGLAPVLHASRATAMARALRLGRGADGTDPARLRGALVAVEVALAVVVGTGALLLVRSYLRVHGVPPGFEAAGVTLVPLALPAGGYATAAEVGAFDDAVLERTRALPGVEEASLVSSAPFLGPNSANLVAAEGRPTDRSGAPDVDTRASAPGYFRAMGIPLRGRDFERGDASAGPPVAVVSEEMARRCWPGEDAIGRRFRLGDLASGPWITVVGVAGDALYRDLEASERRPMVYLPRASSGGRATTLVVRARPGGGPTGADLRAAVAGVDRNVPVPVVRSLEDVLDGALAERRFQSTLCVAFASLGGLLAVVGVHGVMAHFVVRRRPEIAIRMALGATPRSIAAFVLRRGGASAAAGLAAGAAGALALGPVLASQLYGISPTDPATIAAVVVGIGATAALAGWTPARRAMRVDPVQILREG